MAFFLLHENCNVGTCCIDRVHGSGKQMNKPAKEPLFDVNKAKATIEKGARKKWISRRGGIKSGFYYVDYSGAKVTDEERLERIKALVIPPAWKHVRISPSTGSRIQAVGMDTTGRVQYLYDPRYAAKQQRKKFAKIEEFGEFLPKLREITNRDIMLQGFPREKVLAIMLRLINFLYIRVGAEKSAKNYKTYGITTLKNRHLSFGRKGTLIFDFVGKSHVKHRKILVNEDLSSLMKELKDLGGKGKLFHYINDDGKPQPIKASDVNRYLKEATADHFSSKDFRTWGGTLLAAVELAEIGVAEDQGQLKKNVVAAIKNVADKLGNTPTVCRGSYVHPSVISSYEKGKTLDQFTPRKSRRVKKIEGQLQPEEAALLTMIRSNGNGNGHSYR